jgi:hypothetical protein
MNSLRLLVVVASILTSPAAAFCPNDPDTPRGNRGNLQLVPLARGRTALFDPNGPMTITVAGSSRTARLGTGFAAQPHVPLMPAPGSPSSFGAAVSSFADEMVANTRHCLTLNGIVCAPGTLPSGALNYSSTRVDLHWLAQQAATTARSDALLPAIGIQMNPPRDW